MTRGVKLLVAICVLTPVLVAAYVVLASFVLRGPVTEDSLGMSVALEARAIDPDASGCRASDRPREFTCTHLRNDSSNAAYRVRVERDSSCWTAGRIRGAPQPRRLEGCVHRWQWRLLG